MSMFDSVLNGRQSVYLEGKAQRIFRAVERARTQFLQKTRPQSSRNDSVQAGSYIDRLPIELILDIIGRTSWRDCVHLRLVCSGFRALVDSHEHIIVAALLHPRNHHPHSRTNHLTQLSRLFPPPRSTAQENYGARRFTLQYTRTLELRHAICRTLSLHLSTRAVNPLFERAPLPTSSISRRERRDLDARRNQATEIVSSRLTVQLYHVLYFLTHLRLRFRARLAHHAAENTTEDSPTPSQLSNIYRSVQAELLQPFSDATLVSTHHAMHFLVNTIRIAISPERPHSTNDDTVSVMLRCAAPLSRCAEFFTADTPSAPPRLRRQFMIDMQLEREETGTGGYRTRKGRGRSGSSGMGHRANGDAYGGGHGGREEEQWFPKLGEVWFEVARQELRRRGMERHRSDGVYFFPECQGEVLVGCPDCITK